MDEEDNNRRSSSSSTSSTASASRSTSKSTSVHVAIRVRPLNSDEQAQGASECVECKTSINQISLGRTEDEYTFDQIYPPTSTQDQIYHSSIQPLLAPFFQGYNATVFAYGQTGSGKTYTMGNCFKVQDDLPNYGVIPRVLTEIFATIDAESSSTEFCLRFSYLEILNEEIRDLLAEKSTSRTPSLSVREDAQKGIIVAGLTEHKVETLSEVADLISRGAVERATASTNMNSVSSRSHAICTLTMEQSPRDQVETTSVSRISKFHLVDLAGSERAKKTKAQGKRFQEGVNINKGLLALGNVICALSAKKTHVPYRDAKITRLLQDSLGGNSYTAMVACVSPADVNYDETKNTLRYAQRARRIENQATVNVKDGKEMEIMILRQQVQLLQLQLRQYRSGNPPALVTETELTQLQQELEQTQDQLIENTEQLQMALQCVEKYKLLLQQVEPQVLAVPEMQSQLQEIQALQEPNDPTAPKLNEDEAKMQLDDVSAEIHVKETILKALAEPSTVEGNPLACLKQQYEKKITSLERQIDTLEKQYQSSIKAQTSSGTPNATENLRSQLSELRKELLFARSYKRECFRLTKMNSSKETRVSSLQAELLDLKKQQTGLRRQYRDAVVNHRKATRAKELQITQLERQKQKQGYQLTKLKEIQAKQQNVFKRKIEEMVQRNKRMRESNSVIEQQKRVKRKQLTAETPSEDPLSPSFSDQFYQQINSQALILQTKATIEKTIAERGEISSELKTKEGEQKAQLKSLLQLKTKHIQDMQEQLDQLAKSYALCQQSFLRGIKSDRAHKTLQKMITIAAGEHHQAQQQEDKHNELRRKQSQQIENEREKANQYLSKCRELEQEVLHLREQAEQINLLTRPKEESLHSTSTEASTTDETQMEALQQQLALKDKKIEELQKLTQTQQIRQTSAISKKKRKTSESSFVYISAPEDDEEETQAEADDSDYVETPKPRRKSSATKSEKSQPLKQRKRSHERSKENIPANLATEDILGEIDNMLQSDTSCCNCTGRCLRGCACRLLRMQCSGACSCKVKKCSNRDASPVDPLTKSKSLDEIAERRKKGLSERNPNIKLKKLLNK